MARPPLPPWARLLVAGLGLVLEYFRRRSRADRSRARPSPRRSPKRASRPAQERFECLGHCTLLEADGNDGDSFRVRHPDGVSRFRLYWVDTCETRADFPERVRHQARYFGIPESRVPEFGERARSLTLSRLRRGAFEVYTRWEPVMESDRFHAFVRCDGEWLCQTLVCEGLARIFTLPAPAPDGTSEAAFGARLRELEREARRERRGAWGASSLR